MHARTRCARFLTVAVSLTALTPLAHAAGTGVNMLLVVNPNDEVALRLANAYASLRNIPANNILYIATPTQFTYNNLQITDSQFTSTYVTPIANAIASRGLTNQIDYIATIGTPTVFKKSGGVDPIHPSYGYVMNSTTYGLSMLTQYQNGMTPDTAAYNGSRLGEQANDYLLQSFPIDAANGVGALPFNYTPGTNNAIHHSTVYGTNTQYYLASNVGYYGRNANVTPQQLINNLAYTLTGDGARPNGKIYFENNTDSRATGQNAEWQTMQTYMSAHNIAWQQDENTQNTGASPRNKTDVMGTYMGFAYPTVPNGSTYLPGSLASNLTSNPATYSTADQTKSGRFFVAGAAATVGNAIGEPPAWLTASASVFSRDGSTAGEAIYKATYSPYGGLVQGDTLSQPFADIPAVSLAGVPASNAPVSGAFSFTGSASLTSPAYATGIAKLQLYIDGKPYGLPIAGAASTFNVDTTALSDGRHELRVVATNNSAAESQGFILTSILVNNHGQSVATTGATALTAAYNQTLSIPLASTGSSVAQLQLLSLGRNVASLNATSGNLSLDVTKLAFGDNVLTPVALLSDGTQVAGLPITVTRNFNKLAGQTATPAAQRNPGIQYDYWTGKAGRTLATTDYYGTPDYTLHGTSVLQICPNANTSISDPVASGRNIPDAYRNVTGGSNGLLAARISGRFNITTEGEYGFSFDPYQDRWTSLQILIDGQPLTNYDTWVSGSTFNSQNLEGGLADTNRFVYLLPGEHSLTINLANYVAQTGGSSGAAYGDFLMSVPNFLTVTFPDGSTKYADSVFLYTATPEPASLALLTPVLLTTFRRRRWTMGKA